MKTKILFTLVGGLLLFIWQFLSFAFPNFHKEAMRYTPLQDTLLATIERSGLEPGRYILGMPDPALEGDREKMEAEFKAKYEGRPWAVLQYAHNNTMDMELNMVRGVLVCMITAWLFFLVLSAMRVESLVSRIGVGVAVGLIGFLFIPYSSYIWFREPGIWAYLLDGVAPWAILGALGHVFLRAKNRR
jgi:hypothetical protein